MSEACQQYAENFPHAWFNALRNSYLYSLYSLLKLADNPSNEAEFCVRDLAARIGYSEDSLYLAFTYFARIGIIKKEVVVIRGRNRRIKVKLTNFFSKAGVRSACYASFGIAPRFIINLEMLLCVYSGTVLDLKNKRDTLTTSCLSRNLYILSGQNRPSYIESLNKRRARMAQIDLLIKKALQIEKGLLARGETEPIDTAKLTAFSEECLDHAINCMKFATPRHYFRYFLSVCFEWCKNNNTEPNFTVSDFVRMHNLINKSRPEGETIETIKQQLAQRKTAGGTDKKDSYTQERAKREELDRQQQAKFSEAYEKSEAKKRREYNLAAVEGKSFDVNNPFAGILINTLKQSLKEYGPESEDGKRIMAQLEIWGVK